MIMSEKKAIKIQFINGLTFETGVKEILSCVSDCYQFINSSEPDFIIFGPYGIDLPPKDDRYVRIGYFCENIEPDMSLCEWGFGMPLEAEIKHPRYKKIYWHNLDPRDLQKKEVDLREIQSHKTKFCNFLYGHKVPYRENFFKALSKYKKVDAPGKSMNNMPSMDHLYSGDVWSRKKQFLQPYKFTIAFENYSYPGYQTEKLYDAMLTDSIPIYCGDPYIDQIFNSKSFINAFDILNPAYNSTVRWLEKRVQCDFVNMQPANYRSLFQRVERKVKSFGRELKMKCEYSRTDYQSLVDRIVEINENDSLYLDMLKQPWFNNNDIPEHTNAVKRWKDIFN